MGDPPNKIPEEVEREAKRRLAEGESPEDLADDDDLPSRRTLYNFKSELEEQQALQEEMEEEVFRSSTEAGREDILEVLRMASVGVKADGEPKAKVETALNAIEMDSAWDDPHYVRDVLYDEANMTREWANRVVRKAFERPDFPYQEDQGDGRSGRDDSRQRGRRGSRSGGSGRGGGGRGRDSRRGGDGRGDDRRDGNSELRREMNQLRNTVSELTETVTEVVKDDQSDGQMVTIERNGVTMEVPANSPMAYQAMMGDDDGGDDEDFVTKLRQAKDAGIIPSADDFKQDDQPDMFEMLTKAREAGLIGDDGNDEAIEMMGEMMDEMSEQFAEAQSNVATQMSAAISQLAEEDDDDDDLTLEEVKELMEEERKEDKIDRLEQELNKTREEIREEINRSSRKSSDPTDDPEVVKHGREMEFRRDQLKSLNENVQQLPDQLARGVQEGLLPLFDRLQAQAGGGAQQLWSPPQEEPDTQPEYAPDPAAQQSPNAPSPQTAGAAGGGSAAGGYPDPDEPAAPAEGPESPNMGQDEPSAETEAHASDVRSKLGLDDDNDADGAEA